MLQEPEEIGKCFLKEAFLQDGQVQLCREARETVLQAEGTAQASVRSPERNGQNKIQ